MQVLFVGRFGPDPLASLLAEMRHLHHTQCELAYLATAAQENASNIPPFSEFSDKNAYAGTRPSVQFCKSVFVDYSRAFWVFYDRIVASLSGTILKGDHTFKVRIVFVKHTTSTNQHFLRLSRIWHVLVVS
jgi:hypothetical protein